MIASRFALQFLVLFPRNVITITLQLQLHLKSSRGGCWSNIRVTVTALSPPLRPTWYSCAVEFRPSSSSTRVDPQASASLTGVGGSLPISAPTVVWTFLDLEGSLTNSLSGRGCSRKATRLHALSPHSKRSPSCLLRFSVVKSLRLIDRTFWLHRPGQTTGVMEQL